MIFEILTNEICPQLFDGRGPRYSTATRLQLVGPLPLVAPPAAICLCTVLRCLARVRMMAPMTGAVDGGSVNAFLAAALTRVMRAAVPIPAVASASVVHSAAVGGSVVGDVRPL